MPINFSFARMASSSLYEWVDDLERNGVVKTVVHKRWTGKRHEIDTYRYVSAVPLHDADDALSVNWCEMTTHAADTGKVLYRNAFATSFAVDDTSVAAVVASGRARWKIENENNNTLKTKGYHFEHNFGHGKQFLSSLLATLILLAYLLHTLLDLMDDKFCLLLHNHISVYPVSTERTYLIPVMLVGFD